MTGQIMSNQIKNIEYFSSK